jgi:hypothetical protein
MPFTSIDGSMSTPIIKRSTDDRGLCSQESSRSSHSWIRARRGEEMTHLGLHTFALNYRFGKLRMILHIGVPGHYNYEGFKISILGT